MMAEEKGRKFHVLFLPFLTPSHYIPLVDAACLFAAHELKVTIISTPCNTLLFKSSVDQAIGKGHEISVLDLKFPSEEMGLPKGVENFNAVTSIEMSTKVFYGILLLQKPMESLIRDLRPDCIFSDMFYPWTVELAEELKIPRLLFYPCCFLYRSITHSLKTYKPHENVKSDSEYFLIPGLPDKIEMKRSQLEGFMKTKTFYGELTDKIIESEPRSYGLVHHTIYELEPAYAEHYRKIKGKKIWQIGPLFHFSNIQKTLHETTAEKHSCIEWLGTHKPNSVLYIFFGDMVTFSDAQLAEIALALEASDRNLIWVVKKRENSLPLGFEERIAKKNKGLIIRGWAPQTSILGHPAIGGLMSHCDWNLVLEAFTAGVPLITWPLFAEQFYVEKLVEIVGVGVGVGTEVWNPTFEIISPVIGKDRIEEAISRVMCDSEESQQIKRRAKEVAVLVNRAVEEGGSSYNELKALIEEIKSCSFGKNN